MAMPTEGPCRNSPARWRGTSTTTELPCWSTRAWATASSAGPLSGVSSTVVRSVASAVTVTWPAPVRTTIVVRTGAGHVTVTAEATDLTTVELTPLNGPAEDAVAQARVDQQGSSVVVDVPRHRAGLFRQGPSVGIAITCPNGTVLQVKAAYSDVRATGTFEQASVTTGSGDIDVEAVTGAAKLKTGSGTIFAGQVDEALIATTGSGNISVHQSGRSATLNVGSGDISI